MEQANMGAIPVVIYTGKNPAFAALQIVYLETQTLSHCVMHRRGSDAPDAVMMLLRPMYHLQAYRRLANVDSASQDRALHCTAPLRSSPIPVLLFRDSNRATSNVRQLPWSLVRSSQSCPRPTQARCPNGRTTSAAVD
jgi:hypothetical protein